MQLSSKGPAGGTLAVGEATCNGLQWPAMVTASWTVT